MRCRDVHASSSAYLDGELDDVRASALRGHLRTCAACQGYVEDMARLREMAASLQQPEPPPALWSRIQERLADAEVEDARRPWLWLRWQSAWQGLRPRLLPAAVAMTGGVVLALWLVRAAGPETGAYASLAGDPAEPMTAAMVAAGESSSPPPNLLEGLDQARAREAADAERRYRAAIDELSALVAMERASWSPAVASAFDQRMAAFAEEVRRHRGAGPDELAGGAALALDSPERLDELHAVYQRKIRFLQDALLGGEPRLVAAVGEGGR